MPILYSQDISLSDKIEQLKKEKLEAKYWGGDCFIQGMLDFRTIEDSIHGFSIVVPNDPALKIFQKNHIQVMRFHPVKANSSLNIIMEIWTNIDKFLDLRDAYDRDIQALLINEKVFRIGK